MNDADATWRGRVIDARYRVDGVLGRGGMGVVLRAHHEFTGAEVAVKLLREELASDPALQQRFLAEARASNQIGHPGIVQILDAGRDPSGALYLVMELLAGESLREPMRRRELRGAEIARIGGELATALGAAHERGFVHRDLKPENVFLVAPAAAVKLLDFGIAKVAAVGSITATGALLGTPAYMAPEQLTSANTVDARADLWALGVILYELISGQLPYAGTTLHELLAQVATAEPRPIAAVMASAPPAIVAFFARALARDPARRFASTGQLAAALAALPLGGLVAPAPVAAPFASIAVGATQQPAAPIAAGVSSPSQLASWAASNALAAAQPLAASPSAPASASASKRGYVIGAALLVAVGAVVSAEIATHGSSREPALTIAAAVQIDAAASTPVAPPIDAAPTTTPPPIDAAPTPHTIDETDPHYTSPEVIRDIAACKSRCDAARRCNIADQKCEQHCEEHTGYAFFMSEATTDCDSLGPAQFIPSCNSIPTGTSSCRDALACQAAKCRVGDTQCGCPCAIAMSPTHSVALVQVDGCAIVNCLGSRDPMCVMKSCKRYIAACQEQ